ncbi:MAG: iron-sulfur cluster assembly scaffold protein SufE [Candidatus Nitrohelix vancouverensis]|uniref:Nitrogen fixation protein NifU n=1 Tax=Candidatus Nitrohelix vancouverensis TaxID=2705534 RepID=A0A7T0C4W6_9BACT|nr:MAG: iron-sulfur cluster assembly scaffold protein SufE [Candidatus Nitrohelix vancouverensis]
MSVTEESYSAKFEEAGKSPRNRGAYYKEDADEQGMALIESKYKDTKLYWLVDIEENRVYSAKFFAYGGKASVAIGDALCSMVKGLSIEEACSLKGEDVERFLRDSEDTPAVPDAKMELFARVEALLGIVRDDYPGAKGLAIASQAAKKDGEGNKKSFEELSLLEQAWIGLSEEEQIQQINMTLDEKVRPALMNDGGNVQVLSVKDGEKVLIQYQGACGSCGSSLGATLSFIEQALRKDVYNQLIVTPNM